MIPRLATLLLMVTGVGLRGPRPDGRVAGAPLRVHYYALRLRVDPAARSIAGSVRVVGRAGMAPLPRLDLDLAATLTVDSAWESTVSRTRAIVVVRDHDRLMLTPDTPWRARGQIDLTVAYHGTPVGDGFRFEGGGDSARIASYGLPYTARSWWPCRDTPAEKVDSLDVAIAAPAALTAVSNGRWIDRVLTGDGWATTRWAVRYPIYPDVVSLAVARYATFVLSYRSLGGEDMTMPFFVFPEDSVKARADFSVLPAIMQFYAGRFGEYPFLREKYGVAEFPIASFREHQTIPSYGADRITGDHRNDWILAHELAHQWFGDALTVRSWSDVWLNEGFATYAAMLWTENVNGRTAYDSVIVARMQLPFPTPLFVADTTAFDQMFGRVTFFKGALVLHMLRHVLGDATFFRVLRAYIAEHRYGTVTTADFVRVCERISHRPLQWFFREWVYHTGAPTYRLTWSQRRAGRGFRVALTLAQTQDSATFAMPVDIALTTARGREMRTILDSVRVLRATAWTADSVTGVTIDPGNWILKSGP